MKTFIKTILIIFIVAATHFLSYAQFKLNGNAVQLDTKCYQLTPDAAWKIGTMWNLNQISLTNSFDLQLEINLGCHDGNGADGMVFGMQQQSTSAGSAGGGLGFEGVKPSIGVEFDTYQNGGDPSYDHISILKNGIVYHNQGGTLAGPIQADAANANIEDCKYHVARLIWDATTNTLSVYFDCNLRLTYTGDIVNTIFGGNPNVYWGFTAATGSLANDQRVCLNYISFDKVLRDTLICKGSSVQLSATGGTTYSWLPNYKISATNIANPIVSPDTTTTYTVTFTDACGAQYKDSVTVSIIQTTATSIFPTVPYCIADAIDTLKATPTGGIWSGTGITDNKQGTFNPSIAKAGTHIITYTIMGKCVMKDSVKVVVNAIADATITAKSSYCNYNRQDTLKTAASGGKWFGSGITDTLLGVFNPSAAVVGKNSIIYTITGNCGNADTVDITVNAADATIQPSTPFCVTDSIISLSAVNRGGKWSGTGITDTANGIFNPSLAGAGTYYITYTILGVCNDTDTKQIVVVLPQKVNLGNNAILPCNETIAISPNEQFKGYLWNDNSIEQTLTVKTAGIYYLSVTDSNGCHSSDTIVVEADSCMNSVLWIPNAFTPNRDGKNEFFQVEYWNIKEFKADVFNRWGQHLYQWNDVDGGWDGTFKGRQCPEGVYVYIIYAKGIENRVYDTTGFFTLIR